MVVVLAFTSHLARTSTTERFAYPTGRTVRENKFVASIASRDEAKRKVNIIIIITP